MSSPPEYFVSAAGRDDGCGSRREPFRSLESINQRVLPPGSRIWLRAGEAHRGSLRFMRSRGEPDFPIRIEPYDGDTATLEPAESDGIALYNTSGFHFSGLRVIGSGENDASGINVYSDVEGDRRHSYLRFENLEIGGFGRHGISIGSAPGAVGFDDIRLARIHSHHNRLTGILVWGDVGREGDAYAHSRIVVEHCTTDHNPGHPGLGQHSGSGILLCDVDEARIEHCVAHHNGRLNTAGRFGPAGIWVCQCRRALIQHNRSYANATASPTDGGGFGLDGGTVDSCVQYNFSHDNDGPGYLLAQFYSPRPFRRNVVRENVSENDARRNDYGAIHLWAPEGHAMHDIRIENNRVRLLPSAVGRPRGLMVQGPTLGLEIRGNRWEHEVPVLFELESTQEKLLFSGNEVHGPKPGAVIWQGMRLPDLTSIPTSS